MTDVRQQPLLVNYIDNVFPFTNPCSGHVPYTGPEGVRDYRAHLVEDARAVGIGAVSMEQTLDSGYVLRPAPGATLDRPRSCRPGEIGWGVPFLVDWTTPNSGQQITLGDFRQIAEDRATHEGTGAWYPHPEQQTPPGSDGYYKENIYSGRPGIDASMPVLTDGGEVCPEPADNRPPFRYMDAMVHQDTTVPTATALPGCARQPQH